MIDLDRLPSDFEVIFNEGLDALAAGDSRDSCPYFGHGARASWFFGYDCAASDQDTGESQ